VLPLGLAVARLGCIAAGCCAGVAMESPVVVAGVSFADHPVRLYDAAGLLVLYRAARRMPMHLVVPTVLVGFGCLRLFLEPLRPSSEGSMAVEIVCSSWIALGVSLGWREGSRRPRSLTP
jgi:prolipoprotein diacylglyceryltransferase